MVSPPRRNNTLPISLLAAKDSIGMARAAAVGPDIVLVLRVICTSADVLFVSTLTKCSFRGALRIEFRITYRGFNFRIFPEARSIVEINFNTVAGTSREWWKSSIYQMDINVKVLFFRLKVAYRCASGNWQLDIEYDDSSCERGNKGHQICRGAQDISNGQMDWIDCSQG
jgi:hypothetical protein